MTLTPRRSTSSRRRELEQLSDGALVETCAAGDERAWEVLVLRFKRLVYAIPCRAGLAPEQADDVFQITFARLAERITVLEEPHRVRAWLVTTARRLTLDTTRRKRGVADAEAILERTEAPDPAPNEGIELVETQHLVRTALAQLSERCRRLLRLLYYAADERPSYQEVASELEMPVGSIGPTRARCLERLARAYREQTGE